MRKWIRRVGVLIIPVMAILTALSYELLLDAIIFSAALFHAIVITYSVINWNKD